MPQSSNVHVNSYVKPREALGRIKPYSPGKPIWEVQQELGISEAIKLASNENPLGPSPKAIEAIIRSLPELNRYPDAQAYRLRDAIAAKLNFAREQLLVTNGGDELITLISETFLEQGDEVIVPAPSFSEYEFGALLMGAATVEVPLEDGFRFSVDAILAAVTERTKLVYICSPNNPTGTYMPDTELKRLLDSLPEGVLTVYDSAYSHFVTETNYSDGFAFVREGYPIIVLQTFSKIYGLAGIRVGFGAAPEPIMSSIRQVKEPFNVNSLAHEAAAAALLDDEHVSKSRQLNAAGRNQLYDTFRQLGLRYWESMTNFVLVEIGPDAKAVYDRLMTSGVIVRYGATWGLSEHIRVSVGTAEENGKFAVALAAALHKAESVR